MGRNHRLWRARRRHDHIDAELRQHADGWQLEFLRNERPLVRWKFADLSSARQEADRRLRELQRAGWTLHW
jgi:hypothetical protein